MDFNCDRQAKNDFTASTANYLKSKNWDYAFFESDEEGNLIPYGSPDADVHSHMDLYIALYSGFTLVKTYAVELKERWGKYVSTAYGGDGQEGWMYNIPKDGYFKAEQEKGRTPLFCNLYPDGVLTIWNISRISPSEVITKDIKGINIDPQSPKRPQQRLQLYNKDGITIQRMRG